MSYSVKFKSEGPCGWVYYSEDEETLRFYWETTTVGFDLSLPNLEEWIAFCDKHNARHAKQRRAEIVQHLVQEISRRQGRGAKISIDDNGISFSYEGNWFRSALRKILGLD